MATNGEMGLDFKTKSKWLAKQMHNKLADGVLDHLYRK